MNISNIVFDLGRVLIDFQYDELLQLLHDHGATYSSTAELLERVELFAYECGHVTDAKFLENLNNLLQRPVHDEMLRNKWLHVFTAIPPMITLAQSLATRYGVYILSNASSMHWNYLKEVFDIESIGRGQLASFQAGVRKPSPEIYRAAEFQFGLVPSTTVFIDDLAENAEGARQCGWHAIHHVDVETTCRQLADHGIDIESMENRSPLDTA